MDSVVDFVDCSVVLVVVVSRWTSAVVVCDMAAAAELSLLLVISCVDSAGMRLFA